MLAGIFFGYEDTSEMRQEALTKLRALGITHIVCVSHEGDSSQVFARDGIKYLCKKINDGDETALQESQADFDSILHAAVPFIDEAIANGGSALVHCASGAHRSASVVCGYLMIKEKEKLDAVYPLVFAKRPCSFPVYWKFLVASIEPECLKD